MTDRNGLPRMLHSGPRWLFFPLRRTDVGPRYQRHMQVGRRGHCRQRVRIVLHARRPTRRCSGRGLVYHEPVPREAAQQRVLTLIDAHVHVHAAADAPGMLQAAAENFARAARQLHQTRWTGVLLLAEMKQAAWFESVAGAGGTQAGTWSLQPDADDELVLRARNGERELLLIAGRQVVTREGIEVLMLATRDRCPDGLALEETLQRSERNHALS